MMKPECERSCCRAGPSFIDGMLKEPPYYYMVVMFLLDHMKLRFRSNRPHPQIYVCISICMALTSFKSCHYDGIANDFTLWEPAILRVFMVTMLVEAPVSTRALLNSMPLMKPVTYNARSCPSSVIRSSSPKEMLSIECSGTRETSSTDGFGGAICTLDDIWLSAENVSVR